MFKEDWVTYSVFTPKTLEIQAQSVTEQTNGKFSVFHTDSWSYTPNYFLICHNILFHSVSNTAEPWFPADIFVRHVSILLLVKDKSLAHSQKDQLFKISKYRKQINFEQGARE